MPITPKEAAEVKDQSMQDNFTAICAEIDATLKANWYTGRTCIWLSSIVSMKEFRSDQKVRQMVIKAYTDAGWTVEYKTDYRNESTLRFKA